MNNEKKDVLCTKKKNMVYYDNNSIYNIISVFFITICNSAWKAQAPRGVKIRRQLFIYSDGKTLYRNQEIVRRILRVST